MMYFLQKLVLANIILLFVGTFTNSPKVYIESESRSTSQFSVTASNLEEFFDTLLEDAKKSNYPGKFVGDVEWKDEHRIDNNVVTVVRLKPTYTIKIPYWGKGTSLSGECKSMYKDVIEALEEHENEHMKMFKEDLQELKENIESQDDLTVKQLEELIQNWEEEEGKKQKLFDDQTDHGTKDIEFTLSESCKDPN